MKWLFLKCALAFQEDVQCILSNPLLYHMPITTSPFFPVVCNNFKNKISSFCYWQQLLWLSLWMLPGSKLPVSSEAPVKWNEIQGQVSWVEEEGGGCGSHGWGCILKLSLIYKVPSLLDSHRFFQEDPHRSNPTVLPHSLQLHLVENQLWVVTSTQGVAGHLERTWQLKLVPAAPRMQPSITLQCSWRNGECIDVLP